MVSAAFRRHLDFSSCPSLSPSHDCVHGLRGHDRDLHNPSFPLPLRASHSHHQHHYHYRRCRSSSHHSTRQSLSARGRYSRLNTNSQPQYLTLGSYRKLLSIPLLFFLPSPSLSITSSAHCMRGLLFVPPSPSSSSSSVSVLAPRRRRMACSGWGRYGMLVVRVGAGAG